MSSSDSDDAYVGPHNTPTSIKQSEFAFGSLGCPFNSPDTQWNLHGSLRKWGTSENIPLDSAHNSIHLQIQLVTNMADAKILRGEIVQLRLDIQKAKSLGITSEVDRLQAQGWVDDLIKKETEYKQVGGDDTELQTELDNAGVSGTDFTDKIIIQSKSSGAAMPDLSQAWTKQLQHALYRLNEKITLNQDTLNPFQTFPSFDPSRDNPYEWWDRFENTCKTRGVSMIANFPQVAAGTAYSWFASLVDKNEDNFQDNFFREFTNMHEGVWDKLRILGDLKQGTDTPKEFIRRVKSTVRRLYKLKPNEKFSTEQEELAMAGIMNGFSPELHLAVLGKDPKTLKAIEDAASLYSNIHQKKKEAASSETLLSMKELLCPIMQEMRDQVQGFKQEAEVVKQQIKSSMTRPPTPRSRTPDNRDTASNLRVTFADDSCRGCGQKGHFIKNCPNSRSRSTSRPPSLDRSGRRYDTCNSCGMSGHYSNACPNNRSGSADRQTHSMDFCKACGRKGHLTEDCRTNPRPVQRESRRDSYENSNARRGFSNERRPISNNSRERSQDRNQLHNNFDRQFGNNNQRRPMNQGNSYPTSDFNRSRQSGMACFKCGLHGHFARECGMVVKNPSNNRGENRLICQWCGKFGHQASTCYDLRPRPDTKPVFYRR